MKAVHLTTKSAVGRDNTMRAHRLNEIGAPTSRNAHDVIAWLNVERSARYRPIATATYCNIYAYDYATLMGAYLPRVWWTENALARLKNGEEVGVQYGASVVEMNANALYDWFNRWGATFGWQEVNATAAQANANAGKCVIGVAARIPRGSSGHIVAVAPEGELYGKAEQVNGVVLTPLQSQAGRTNFKYKTVNWWRRGYEPMKWWVSAIETADNSR